MSKSNSSAVSEEIEVKGCPFCGKKLYKALWCLGLCTVYQHFSDECFLGDFEISGMDAIERWNRRVEEVKENEQK